MGNGARGFTWAAWKPRARCRRLARLRPPEALPAAPQMRSAEGGKTPLRPPAWVRGARAASAAGRAGAHGAPSAPPRLPPPPREPPPPRRARLHGPQRQLLPAGLPPAPAPPLSPLRWVPPPAARCPPHEAQRGCFCTTHRSPPLLKPKRGTANGDTRAVEGKIFYQTRCCGRSPGWGPRARGFVCRAAQG